MDWWILAYCLSAVVIFMTAVFFIARAKNRYDLVDVAWGLTFVAIATICYIDYPMSEFLSIQTLVTFLILLWGIRLSIHMFNRWNHRKSENWRYAELRKKYRKAFGGLGLNMYVRVFLWRAILAVVISLPVIVVNSFHEVQIGFLALFGAMIWAVGFYFEAIADDQLNMYTKNHRNRGKLITQGLWRYSRHPNYFGEVTMWWGIFVIALSAPFGLATVISPLLVTILILFITGVPVVERRLDDRLGWSAYKKRTSKFLPIPPKTR